MSLPVMLLIAALYGGGLYLLLGQSLVRKIFGIALWAHAVNLLALLVSGGDFAPPPIVPPGEQAPLPGAGDPLPQALVLTAIVIGFALQTVVLVMVHRTLRTRKESE